jgi:hypothetical protein
METIKSPELSDNQINNFLKDLVLEGLTPEEQTKIVVNAVAEIPWGEGRSVDEVFEKGVGTCTGKHKVLQACFDQLGIKYEPVVCTFKWSEQGVQYPEELQSILDQGEWEHGHNFVKLENGNYLDITWDSPLKYLGFKTLPEDWTPNESFVGVQNIKEQWDGVSIDKMKSQIIGYLDPETKERRERFLHGFIEWIDAVHKEQER